MIFAALIYCPTETLVPFNWTFPALGNVLILTPLSVFAGISLVSQNQKFAVVKVYCTSSLVVTVLVVPAGASFTLFTVSTKLSCADALAASVTVSKTADVPNAFATGFITTVHPVDTPPEILIPHVNNTLPLLDVHVILLAQVTV